MTHPPVPLAGIGLSELVIILLVIVLMLASVAVLVIWLAIVRGRQRGLSEADDTTPPDPRPPA